MEDSPFWQCQAQFYSGANKLRDFFDQQFEKPLETREERFCWDYWYVKDQYKLMRTPAYHYFPDKLYKNFENHLTEWGRRNLGCHNISPTWLSYYVDGCEQQMHTDAPHGPWAFVYSLTNWDNRPFTGGETFLLKPETLCYWDFFDQTRGIEKADLLQLIPSHFNQLTVFDPRLPHGVQPVHGVSHPPEGRIVIHGWFTEPGPSVTGALSTEECEQALNTCLEPLHEKLSQIGVVTGLLSFQLDITTEGTVSKTTNLSNTLIEINSRLGDDEIIELISKDLSSLQLPIKDDTSEIILPFIFGQ